MNTESRRTWTQEPTGASLYPIYKEWCGLGRILTVWWTLCPSGEVWCCTLTQARSRLRGAILIFCVRDSYQDCSFHRSEAEYQICSGRCGVVASRPAQFTSDDLVLTPFRLAVI